MDISFLFEGDRAAMIQRIADVLGCHETTPYKWQGKDRRDAPDDVVLKLLAAGILTVEDIEQRGSIHLKQAAAVFRRPMVIGDGARDVG